MLTFLQTPKGIHIALDGKVRTISSEEASYEEVLAAVKAGATAYGEGSPSCRALSLHAIPQDGIELTYGSESTCGTRQTASSLTAKTCRAPAGSLRSKEQGWMSCRKQ